MQNAFVQSSDLPDCFGLSMENWNEKFEQNFANEIEVRLLAYSTFPATQVTAVGFSSLFRLPGRHNIWFFRG